MKTLTIRAPWSSLIVGGHKRVECRNLNTSYRGTILIHSAGRPWVEPTRGFTDRFLLGQRVERPEPVFSALLGTVELVDVIPAGRRHELPADVRPWAFDFYSHYWVLADPRPFPQPIPFTGGRLGLYDVPDSALGRPPSRADKMVVSA